MVPLNFFKKKKKEESEGEEGVKLSEKPRKEPEVSQKEKKTTNVYKVLKSPQVTEKATSLTSKNQYLFKVWKESNKTEIKKAIENIYGVNVIDVKIINIPPKKRRLGRTLGQRKGYKKAVVKIREGQKIEVLPR